MDAGASNAGDDLVSQSQEHSSTVATGSSRVSRPSTKTSKKQKKGRREVADVLEDLLTDSRKELKDLSQKVNTTLVKLLLFTRQVRGILYIHTKSWKCMAHKIIVRKLYIMTIWTYLLCVAGRNYAGTTR